MLKKRLLTCTSSCVLLALRPSVKFFICVHISHTSNEYFLGFSTIPWPRERHTLSIMHMELVLCECCVELRIPTRSFWRACLKKIGYGTIRRQHRTHKARFLEVTRRIPFSGNTFPKGRRAKMRFQP